MKILGVFCAVVCCALGLSLVTNQRLLRVNGTLIEIAGMQRETIDLMKAELMKSCHGTVPYVEGMTLLPGQTAVVTIPVEDLPASMTWEAPAPGGELRARIVEPDAPE